MQSINDKPRGKAITIIELAEFLDVSDQRIRQLMREGMPVFEKGVKGKQTILSSRDTFWWYVEYEQKKKRGAAPSNSAPDDAKSRITETRAQMVELQLAERRGDLFHFSDWLPFIKDKLVVFRQAMQTVTENVRDRYGNEVAAFVDKQTTASVNSLSNGLATIPKEVKE